ncbi:hypothetical protein TONV_032 [Tipula oleracea nudivirus]|uniref:Uncharacterized protein n=1 Tax=Tipula oleracea nudivirus TaxID=1546257 RepID=A0A0B4VFR2_9VIRU|nr:hypothetical protein TONV_032 [Tipula oleracea nudivirus]AJD20092.1 hypothetical protein TONV_032 [Tipula oleracea nudivirus]
MEMDYKLIWGVLSVVVILILIIMLVIAYHKPQLRTTPPVVPPTIERPLNLVIIDNSAPIAENGLTSNITAANTESDEGLIHIYKTTTKYAQAGTLPSNVLELKNTGIVYSYVIVGKRYEIISKVLSTTESTADIVTLKDTISNIEFKILTITSTTPTANVTSIPSSITIPADSTSITIRSNLKKDREVITNVATTKIFFISFEES